MSGKKHVFFLSLKCINFLWWIQILFLTDPVKIVQGSVGEASEDVEQIVKVVDAGGHKWQWVLSKLVEFTSIGSVLIFVTKKANCEELGTNLIAKDFDLKIIHGDLLQHERNQIINSFRK